MPNVTENYGLKKPLPEEFYNVQDQNDNMDVIDAELKKKYDPNNKPTKSDVGLNNVPNVSTNNQTPTYTEVSTIVTLVSGEKLSVAFGKIAKAVKDLISHIANKSNPHGVTAAQVGAFGYGRSITANEDLNSIIKPGSYYVSVANSTSVKNMPVASAIHVHVFMAETGYTDTPYRVLQIATRTNPTASDGNILWYRAINVIENYYGDWKEISTTDYAVNKAGDIMTGPLLIEHQGTNAIKVKRITEGVDVFTSLYSSGSSIGSDKSSSVIKYTNGSGNEAILLFNSAGFEYHSNSVKNTILHTGNKDQIFTYGTDDLTAGTSALETGKLYFVYE